MIDWHKTNYINWFSHTLWVYAYDIKMIIKQRGTA